MTGHSPRNRGEGIVAAEGPGVAFRITSAVASAAVRLVLPRHEDVRPRPLRALGMSIHIVEHDVERLGVPSGFALRSKRGGAGRGRALRRGQHHHLTGEDQSRVVDARSIDRIRMHRMSGEAEGLAEKFDRAATVLVAQIGDDGRTDGHAGSFVMNLNLNLWAWRVP